MSRPPAHRAIHPIPLPFAFATQQLQTLIDNAWENRASPGARAAPKEIRDAVEHVT